MVLDNINEGIKVLNAMFAILRLDGWSVSHICPDKKRLYVFIRKHDNVIDILIDNLDNNIIIHYNDINHGKNERKEYEYSNNVLEIISKDILEMVGD